MMRNVLNRFLFWLTARLPCRLIKLNSGPYLERYYLGQLLGATFYLHRFVSSDSERHVHNHPWVWGRSVILLGSYIEELAFDLCPHANGAGCVTTRVHRKWFNRVDAATFHRIHDAEPGTWTLFFHGERGRVNGKYKGWGFIEALHVGEGSVTIFRPWASEYSRWWLSAPLGRDVGRVGLVPV